MARLLNKLRGKYGDKYVSSNPKIGYPTGFLEFDYKNGMEVKTQDVNSKEIYQYDSLGIQGGSLVTVVGPSGSGKTAFVAQLCATIAKRFPDSEIYHNDIEGAFSETRFANLSGWSLEEVEDKYTLISEEIGHNYLTSQLQDIYDAKIEMKDELLYDTGMLNKYGKPIHVMQPTFIILDSLPTLMPEDLRSKIVDNKELANASRFPMEVAKANAQLVKFMTPLLKTANIIYIMINHVADDVSMDLFKKKAFLNYLPNDKKIPGGNAPVYYSNNLFYLAEDTAGKLREEKGFIFDGFKVKIQIIKSRSNKSGQSIILPYNQTNGFSQTFHIFELLKRFDLIEGRSPHIRVKGFDEKDLKFSVNNFIEKFNENEKLREVTIGALLPILKDMLSKATKDSTLADVHDMYSVLTNIDPTNNLKIGF